MNTITLVDYTEEYFNRSKDWLSDCELNHLIHAGPLPSDEERLTWFNSLPSRLDYLIWGVDYGGEPIGVCGFKHIVGGKAEYWGYIGEKNLWGKGLGKDLLDASFQKAQLFGINTIWLRVRKYNLRAINLYKRKGFSVEIDEVETYLMSKQLEVSANSII